MISIGKRFHIGKGVMALSCLLVMLVAALLTHAITYADGITYKWIDDNTIEVSGPGITPGQKLTYAGSGGLSGGKAFNGSIATTGGCTINASFNVSDNNTVRVTSNNNTIVSPSAPKTCDDATKDKYFKVGSTAPVTGTPAPAPETDAQKQTCITVETNFDPGKNPPDTIDIKVTGPNGEQTVTLNRDTTTKAGADSGSGKGNVNYSKCVPLDPGKYTICPPAKTGQACQTFDKIRGQNASPTITAEGYAGRVITVRVHANNLMCDPNTGQVLQSFTAQLKDKDGNVIDTISTNPVTSAKYNNGGAWDQPVGAGSSCTANFTSSGDFSDVNPGNYTVCLVGFDQCQGVQKTAGQPSAVDFNIGGQDAQNMLKNQDEIDANKGVTCSIEKLGWMLCPIIRTMSHMSDEAFKFLAENLLQVDPKLIDNGNKGTFAAWSTFRDLANIAFVAAFLFLIYSQITGLGASNYGIKKMLPRLIVAAILVNASYYICQLAVDVTNVLGFELKKTMTDIAKDMYDSSKNEYSSVFASGNLPLTALATLILGAAAVWVMLPMLSTIAVSTIVAILAIIIILLLRKAFIVLLIAISPLAFVAYLLPNTERYFNKWRKMFTDLLMVFPIVSLLFGAGQPASAVIMNSGADFTNRPSANAMESSKTSGGDELTGKQEVDLSMGLVATGLTIAPLFAVYAVLKGAISSANAIGGWVESRRKGAMKAGAAHGQQRDTNSAYNRGRAIRGALAKNYKQKRMLRRLGQSDTAMGKYTKVALGGVPTVMPDKLRTPIMKAQAGRINRMAIVAGKKVEDEEIEEAKQNLRRKYGSDYNNLIPILQQSLSEGMTESAMLTAKAAAGLILKTGGVKGVDAFAATIAALEVTLDTNSPQMRELKSFIIEKHADVENKSSAIFTWAADDGVGTGRSKDLATHIANPDSYNYLTDKEISTQTPGSLKNMIQAGALDKQKAQRILTSGSASDLGGDQRKILENIR